MTKSTKTKLQCSMVVLPLPIQQFFSFLFIFLGEWKNGLKHGKGVEKTKEGRYEGEWKDNMVLMVFHVHSCKILLVYKN